MFRLIASFSLLMCLTLLPAQEGLNVQMGISVEPGMSWLIFDEPDLSPAAQSVHTSVSGRLFLHLDHCFRAEMGAGFRLMEIHQTDYAIRWGCDHDGNGGYDPFHSWEEVDYSHYYLSVPVGLRYRFKPQGHSFYIRGGASAEFYLGRSGGVNVYECGLPSSIQHWPGHQPKRILILGRAGIGYERQIRERSSFFIEPAFTWSFSRLFKPSSLINNSRFLVVGVAAGWVFG